MAGKCGTCTACCRVFAIASLKKPAGRWCEHCEIGVGCKIYADRPMTCIDFTCMWLESFNHGAPFKDEMRPDKCKVVFSATTHEFVISATTMPGYSDAWKKGAAKEIIDILIEAGVNVAVSSPGKLSSILIDKTGQREVEMSEPDENGIQWNKEKVKLHVPSTRMR